MKNIIIVEVGLNEVPACENCCLIELPCEEIENLLDLGDCEQGHYYKLEEK